MYLENPVSFISVKETKKHLIEYKDLIEIAQGGPEVGQLFINNLRINNYLFGGPFILDDDYIYIPVLLKKFLGKGFKIARINLFSHQIDFFGGFENLIWLFKIEEDFVYYYKDMEGLKYNKVAVKTNV